MESFDLNAKIGKSGTGDEPTLVKRRPNDSEFLDLDAKIDKSGIGEVKTLSSNEPTLLDFKEFYGLKSQFAHLEKLIAQISDKQATLVNKMAAKPEESNNKDEDLKVIDVSPIKSLFCNMNLNNDGT